MRSAYLSSSFDLLNVEDLDLIAQARGLCDQLVLGVYSDELVERLYGRLPVVGLEERMALLRHVRGVSDVRVHDDVEPTSFATDGPDGPDGSAGSDGPDKLCLIGVDGGPDEALPAEPAVWLTSRRQTESLALRRALQSALDDGVAVA